MKNSLRVLAAVALGIWIAPSLYAAEPAITPRPLMVADQPGAPVRIADRTPIVVPAGDVEAASAAYYLADLSRRSGEVRLTPAARTGGGAAIRLLLRPGLPPEGYALDIGKGGVTISASTRAGLLYGAVSFWQMLTAAHDGLLAPVHIDDAPRFAWRGMLLDSARHFQSPATIARMLDWMALHKLNRLQWHLADDQGWRLEIKRYPRLTGVAAWRSTPPAAGIVRGRYGGFYTQAEVRRLVALAAARNITIVPEIDMPGHATAAILAYSRVGLTTMTAANLGDWGVFPSIYGVDRPALEFLHGVLDEVMALFPSREIAIGGDEAVHNLWHASPAVQGQMRALGIKDEAALQGWFVGQIGSYLNAHGRRLVGWDEILGDKALAKNDVVLSWHGADGAIAAAETGHDVVMATAPTLYFDNRQSTAPSEPTGRGFVVSLRDVYDYDPGNPPHPAGSAMLGEAAAHVIGVQAQLWTEHIPIDAQIERMALPRAAALAEIGWTARNRHDWASFVARLPAMYARYHALGLDADDGAVVPQATVTTSAGRVGVALHRQIDLGDIRYTTDSSVPLATSAPYTASLALALPTRLRAASFAGSQQLSRVVDLPLDAVSATRKTSQQLDLCTDAVSLNLAGPPVGGRIPAYLVDIKNPCWIDRGVDLGKVRTIAVSVAALPFNFQLNEPTPQALPLTKNRDGELVVRRGCDGPLLASVPLTGVPTSGAPAELIASIPPQRGVADLCLTLARPKLDPLWVLGQMELRP